MVRIQKSQLPNPSGVFRWENGQSGVFDIMPYLAAGFTKYDVMVVGAGGGPGGEVQATVSSVAYKYYGSGGGGGEFARRKGNIKDLISRLDSSDDFFYYSPIYYGAGAAGTPGAPKLAIGTAGTAGDGTGGGRSYFGTYDDDGYYRSADAFGGSGGEGATIQSGTVNILARDAGWGGGADFSGGTPAGDTWSTQVPGNGSYSEDVANGIWLGKGGGGALGKVMSGATVNYTARAGGQGAYHASLGAAYRCPGEAIYNTNYSGGGGGANVAPWTGGSAEYRGRGGRDAAERAGVCLLRLT